MICGINNVKSTSTSSAKKSRTDDQEIETDGNDTYDDILEEEIPAVALNDHFCEEYYQMWHHFHAI
jgi:hypothetical protein